MTRGGNTFSPGIKTVETRVQVPKRFENRSNPYACDPRMYGRRLAAFSTASTSFVFANVDSGRRFDIYAHTNVQLRARIITIN